ncbi:GNAT family N-acetyltransferase [Acidaminobacter sp. JC074]|uniref:GNAT family N-acetyltransferase n=1 Tax=Acidaminobacter sp. JC074 TaxID=2530199 RepID=UPI001F115732|nr:GNAT family N-acetyltransferase [Acidaminobacter sp. JC074]
MDKYKIRKADIDDGDLLGILMKNAYSIYDRALNLPPLFADYKEEIKLYPCWVIEVEGRIIGGLFMYFDEKAYINNIALDPDFKGKGYGRILMDFAEKTASDKAYDDLHLATHIKLKDNINYYIKLGYEEVERDENKVYFRKRLI